MTHENVPNGEAEGGPENDLTLPGADDVPTFDTPEESDLPLPVGPVED